MPPEATDTTTQTDPTVVVTTPPSSANPTPSGTAQDLGGGGAGAPGGSTAGVSQYAMEQALGRIAKLTARNKELEARVNAGTATPGERAANEANLEELAEAKAVVRAKVIAEQTLAQRAYDQDCANLVSEGKKAYGEEEFDKKVKQLATLFDSTNKEAAKRFTTLVQATIDSGEGPKLVYLLGDDTAEAAKIMTMSPGKMAAALMKLSQKEPPQELSGAPKPIVPIGSRGQRHEDIKASDRDNSSKLTTEAWMARRNVEVEAYNKKMGRRVI